MEYTIQELAHLAGISTRTLRYYDQIGLLSPVRDTVSNYRIYTEAEVDVLQQILFYKEMGLELSAIEKILKDPNFDRIDALTEHLSQLMETEQNIRLLIQNVKKTIRKEKGETDMTDKEKFIGLKNKLVQENEEKYGTEIRGKYGDKNVEESNQKMMNLTQEEYDAMKDLDLQIKEELEKAVTEGAAPDGDAGIEIAELHKKWLTFTWSSYSAEAHIGLAQMYVCDERFTAYYDENVSGCAEFLRDAILNRLK